MTEVSDRVLSVRGREWQSFGQRKKSRLVESAFRYWRHNGFPYYVLGHQEIGRDYKNLSIQPIAPMRLAGVGGSTIGLRLANYFQPHMWSVRVSRYLSPHDVFHDDALLRAAIHRSWTIWPDRFGANPATLRRILKTYPGAASVSNFRPTVARSVLHHFSKDSDTIVDFSAGYGGRLLGALSMKRSYIGIEPCAAQVAGLESMLESLKKHGAHGSAEVLIGCAEDVMRLLPENAANLVFSSPPYFDWEKYSHEASQSFIRYSSYDDWKSGFLEPVIGQSLRVLKRGGKFVVNISGGRRKPDANDVRMISLAVGLQYLGSIPLLISRVPYLHPRNDAPHKHEEILVFGKP
jgi:DNA methylase